MRKTVIILFLSILFSFSITGIAYLHHMLVAGLNPFLSVITMPVVVIIAVLVARLLVKGLKKYISFTPAILFIIGALSFLMSRFVLQVFFGNSALDMHLHDTYYIVSYSYQLFFLSAAFAVCAAAYHFFPKIFAKPLNNTLGYIHFWISFLTTSLILLPTQYANLAGMPRRYYDYYSISAVADNLYRPNQSVSAATYLLLAAQLLFLYNLLYSLFKRQNAEAIR